ncbi:hypothetical protein GCM10022198_02060 [Klugiella xanthotipulae]|uniref:Uncharacterized protein DUF4129 n=1 Tax=Klugiella xanthotipulae TaxID=244735 RepID=A0A543I520_9MICO|nr:DUF4129 domain-containing protein [Klugiella xanthotipulae]TQM65659.1 uncharacterized protein DUF4129 [Klugiella xanthotipulae]
MRAASATLLSGIPLDPDADEARQLLERELAQPAYTSAQPNWFDLLSERVWEWVLSLFSQLNGGGSWGAWGQVVVVGVLVALITAALLIFGLPRLRHRQAGENRALFGEAETRSAAELRAAAAEAARAADWNLAVVECYRAIARSLDDRVIVTVLPGMTAQTLATEAAHSVTREREALRVAARAFDAARYLNETLTPDHYAQVTELDTRLRGARVTAGAVPPPLVAREE